MANKATKEGSLNLPPLAPPQPAGQWMLGWATVKNPDGSFQVPPERMPRGNATRGAAPAVSRPPADFSINTAAGRPPRKARGRQFGPGGQ